MSRNVITTSSSIGQVHLVAGWDRPLQEIFCSVQPLEDIDDKDFPACLLQTSFGSAAAIAECLKAAGIVLPQQMLDAIQQDADTQVGNVIRVFNADGTIERETPDFTPAEKPRFGGPA